MKHRNYSLISRTMQIILTTILLTGIHIGETKVIVNAAISLIITFTPAILERKYKITLDPLLSLWITSAVFMHAIGAVNIGNTNLYTKIHWWDHLTHTLSATVVAAVGYTAFRTIEEHSNEIHVPKKLLFIFILIFVIAFGVIWEVLEFTIALLAKILGGEPILTQYGLEDTMKDLIFNTIGGITVAIIGEAYLNNTIQQIKQKIENQDLLTKE